MSPTQLTSLRCWLGQPRLPQGEFSGMVTAPVQSTLIGAGNDFVGHTEFLAQRLG